MRSPALDRHASWGSRPSAGGSAAWRRVARHVAASGLVLALLVSGCVAPATPPAAAPEDDAVSEPSVGEPFVLAFHGRVVLGYLDVLMHMQPTEPLLFGVQPAGWSLTIDGEPEAIEMMVAWDGDAVFRLHPHYLVSDDPSPGGTTHYHGYMSPRFTSSPGCVRIPAADVAAGKWQAMIHPSGETMDVHFTLSVAVLGGEATLRNEMHGHRADGPTVLTERGWDPCSLLVDAAA